MGGVVVRYIRRTSAIVVLLVVALVAAATVDVASAVESMREIVHIQ